MYSRALWLTLGSFALSFGVAQTLGSPECSASLAKTLTAPVASSVVAEIAPIAYTITRYGSRSYVLEPLCLWLIALGS